MAKIDELMMMVMNMPPGFRFHPTDEELITHYLSKKALNNDFSSFAIGEVDLNKVEPWDLPWKAKMGEKEWYFFCVRDKKYPTGLRTNRATEKGYWKATGKDREIFRGGLLIGMKKTLVFYMGRAPKGEKSNWVMHEYRLEGEIQSHEWVICRVFHKAAGGKKVPISGLFPIMNSDVPCFSNPSQLDIKDYIVAPAPPAPINPIQQYPDQNLIQDQNFMVNTGDQMKTESDQDQDTCMGNDDIPVLSYWETGRRPFLGPEVSSEEMGSGGLWYFDP